MKQLFIKEADKTILNRSKEYYKNDKERLRERERQRDRETDREKEKKINGRIWQKQILEYVGRKQTKTKRS